MPTIIQTVSAPTGGGKTYSASRYAIDQSLDGRKILIVQPTTQLIEQTFHEIKRLDRKANVTAYHADDGRDGPVHPRIANHFADSGERGEILIITHASFELLRFIPSKARWNLIYDEAVQVDYAETFSLNKNRQVLLDLIEPVPSTDDSPYLLIKSRNNHDAKGVAQNVSMDQVSENFRNLAAKLTNEHFSIYVLKSQYDNFCTFAENDDARHQLAVLGILAPTMFDGFASVTVMGACLNESLMHHVWHRQGVTFKENTVIKELLRYTEHPNGNLLDIFYVTEHPWSKNVRDTKVTEHSSVKPVVNLVHQGVLNFFRSKTFVYMDNNGSKLTMPASAVRLPNVSHGLNTFQSYHHAVVFSALNPTPQHCKFLLEMAGLDAEQIRRGRYHQAVYQAASRISLRDINDQNRKQVVVMDKASAEHLARQFVGASISQLPKLDISGLVPTRNPVGRPIKYATDEERLAATREQNRLKNANRRNRVQKPSDTGMICTPINTI
jgi:hypothetical protein